MSGAGVVQDATGWRAVCGRCGAMSCPRYTEARAAYHARAVDRFRFDDATSSWTCPACADDDLTRVCADWICRRPEVAPDVHQLALFGGVAGDDL